MSDEQAPKVPPQAASNDNTQAQSNAQSTNSSTPTPYKPVQRVGKLIPTKKSTLFIMFFVLLVGIGLIMWAWRIGPFHTMIEQTDNSYVKGKTTVLSSQINGYIKEAVVLV